jgi:hypothetical protein
MGMRWAERVERMEELRNAYILVSEKGEGKRSLGSPRGRLKDNIKMYLKGIRYKNVEWIHVSEDMNLYRPLVNTVMNLPIL